MLHHASAPSIALCCDLFSVSLDPLTEREIRRGFLPIGALIEDAMDRLAGAEANGLESVTVHVRAEEGSEWFSLERVGTAALRSALRL